jgi:hypothetical protein
VGFGSRGRSKLRERAELVRRSETGLLNGFGKEHGELGRAHSSKSSRSHLVLMLID